MDYAASKAAVDTFTIGLAKEVARAILWLASRAASYCTGTLLEVAGGR